MNIKPKFTALLSGVVLATWGLFVITTGQVGYLRYADGDTKYYFGGALILTAAWFFYVAFKYWNSPYGNK